jgi:predicted transcriptional regulator
MICQLFSKGIPLRSSDLAVLIVGIVIVIVAVVTLSLGARPTQTVGTTTTSLETFSSLSYSAPSTTISNMVIVTISNTTVTVQPPIQLMPYPYTATASYTATVKPRSSASYDGLILLTVSIVVFGAAFVRIHDYRTRIHIYHEIIQYVAQSPRIPSHIMRKCNLETGKFQKYISILGDRGFVQKVPADGDHYRATDKAIDYLRDRKLSEFLSELR